MKIRLGNDFVWGNEGLVTVSTTEEGIVVITPTPVTDVTASAPVAESSDLLDEFDFVEDLEDWERYTGYATFGLNLFFIACCIFWCACKCCCGKRAEYNRMKNRLLN